MSGHLISPLVLPKRSTDQRANDSGGRTVRRPLPVAGLPLRSTGSIVYVIATIERRGRLIAHGAFEALDWPPGTMLELRDLSGGHVLVHRSESGTAGINPRGHLYLPTSLRTYVAVVPPSFRSLWPANARATAYPKLRSTHLSTAWRIQ